MSEDTCGHLDWGCSWHRMGRAPGGCSTAPRTAPHGGCWAPKVTSAEAETLSQAALLKLLTRRQGSWDCVENEVVIYEQFQETRAAPLIPAGFTPRPLQGTLGDVSTFMVVVTGEVFLAAKGDGA